VGCSKRRRSFSASQSKWSRRKPSHRPELPSLSPIAGPKKSGRESTLPNAEEFKLLRQRTGATVVHWLTSCAAFTVPRPVAKSQPGVVAYAGLYAVFDVESTPFVPEGR